VQLVEHSTHRDDVVVRVGRKHDHALARRKLAPSADLRDQGIEYFAVQWTGFAVAREQRAEMVLTVVVLVELENRLLRNLAQPDDGIDLPLSRPLHLAGYPGSANARQVRGRREVDVENSVRVLL